MYKHGEWWIVIHGQDLNGIDTTVGLKSIDEHQNEKYNIPLKTRESHEVNTGKPDNRDTWQSVRYFTKL